jgi:hypothetical protein
VLLVRAAFLLPLVAVLGAAPACGSEAATNFDGGTLPEASTFTPTPPASCGSEPMMCSQEFIYRYEGESYVELVGSWGVGTWTNGIYMNHASNIWQAFVPVVYGQPVSYAFVVNGTTQVTDPGNSHYDANGNSVTPGIDCASFTCAEPAEAGAD